jgi:hypothetical protein
LTKNTRNYPFVTVKPFLFVQKGSYLIQRGITTAAVTLYLENTSGMYKRTVGILKHKGVALLSAIPF